MRLRRRGAGARHRTVRARRASSISISTALPGSRNRTAFILRGRADRHALSTLPLVPVRRRRQPAGRGELMAEDPASMPAPQPVANPPRRLGAGGMRPSIFAGRRRLCAAGAFGLRQDHSAQSDPSGPASDRGQDPVRHRRHHHARRAPATLPRSSSSRSSTTP